MFDFIVGFSVGYFLRALLSSTVKHDMLLSWDPSSLGWRSVPPGSKLHSGKRYLAAIEIKAPDVD